MANSNQSSTSRAKNSASQRASSAKRSAAQRASETGVSKTALATGAAALIGAVAGLFMLKKSGKTLGEVADDVSARVKDGIADATQRAKDSGWIKDGLDEDRSQAEIAEEALTLKETGKKTSTAGSPMAQQELKAGIAQSNQEAKAGVKAVS